MHIFGVGELREKAFCVCMGGSGGFGQGPQTKEPIERKAEQKQISPNNLSFWIKLCLKYYSWVFPSYESISPVLQNSVYMEMLSFAQERNPN